MLYLALEQQRIIAADMVIAEVQKKKWVDHVKFMKYLRWTYSRISLLIVYIDLYAQLVY